MATTQDELPAGNVAKLVNQLSKDPSKEIVFRKSGSTGLTKFATVRYSYVASQDDELTLKVDDVIEVIEEAEAGWMKGKLRSTGEIGLFPTNFVHFSESRPVSKNGIAKIEAKKKIMETVADESPEALQRSSLTDIQKARCTASFTATGVKKSDEGDLDVSTTKEMARVLYQYTPNHDDELALKTVGAMVTVISKTCADPGWFLGEIDGKRGLIPDNFVEFVMVSVSTTEGKKASIPTASSLPTVPAKPAKPPGLITSSAGSGSSKSLGTVSSTAMKPPSSSSPITGSGTRAGSRVCDAAFATTLAEALNKQPKPFGVKPPTPKYEEGPPDTRTEGPLEHITTSRPKQPNKRPPSTIFNKRKSNDFQMDSSFPESSESEATLFSKRTATTSSVPTFSTQTTISMPSAASPVTTVIKSEKGDNEYVTYAEYKRLSDKFQEFQNEILSKFAQLEAKLASTK